MLLCRLLWDPLPDALPGSGLRRLPRLRDLAAAMTADASWVSEQEHVSRRVRRGAVQALVREAYRATVAEQDREHHPPAAFTRAWQDHLASLLKLPRRELPGWGTSRSPPPISICPGACTSWQAGPVTTQSSTPGRVPAAPSSVASTCRPSTSRSSARGSHWAMSHTGPARPAAPACCTKSSSPRTGSSAGSGALRSASSKSATLT